MAVTESSIHEKVSEMYRQGHGYTAISKALGIARTTVRRILDKAEKKAAPIRKHVELPISDIRLDGDTQMRVTLVDGTIGDYRDEMLAGVEFPPVVVYFDGTAYWLADGFHRLHAALAAGRDAIIADVYEGSARDARCHSMSANADHGLRRSNADKRNAVEMALADEEWSKLPNTKIAEMCAVAESFVRKVKQEHEYASHSATVSNDDEQQEHDYAWPDTVPAAPPAPIGAISGTFPAEDVDAAPGSAKAPFEWRFRFNPRLRRLRVISPRGEQMLFHSREELQGHIANLEQQLGAWSEDDGA